MTGVTAALFRWKFPHRLGFLASYPATVHNLQVSVPVSVHCRHKNTTVDLPYKKLADYSDFSIAQPGKGKVYDKKPFKVTLIKGKKYAWCICGWSKSQPFCDGAHNYPLFRIKLKPVWFIAPESGDYWLCNCKQTSQRPFCDGTHRDEEIQSKIKS